MSLLNNIIKKKLLERAYLVTGHCNRAAVSRNRYGVEKNVDTHKILILVNLHRNRRYFVIKLHTWFGLSYFLKTNIKFYCIYQYFMSINSFFNIVSVSRYSRNFNAMYLLNLDVFVKQHYQEKTAGTCLSGSRVTVIGHWCFPTSTRKFT
jgi:hypothetical protein